MVERRGMRKGSQPVSVVIPAYNEESAVASEVETVRRALAGRGIAHEIIVVDDGSGDATGERAREAGARVIRHVENRGYGASLKTGIRAARHEAIVITDADGTYPPDQIPALLAELPRADMVVGARTGSHVRIPWVRRPAKWVLGWLANRIAGRRIPDLNSGLRAFHRDCVAQYFAILPDQFSFTTTVTLAFAADGYRTVYLPIDYHARVGQSKIRASHFMEFVMLVLRMAMLFQPLRVFLPLSLVSVVGGAVKAAADVVAFLAASPSPEPLMFFERQAVLSTSAVLLMLVGLQLLLIGLVAEGLLRRIAQRDAPLLPSRAVVSEEVAAGAGSARADA
jgi:glycosyltransferase involved in cell wall biosynthesis